MGSALWKPVSELPQQTRRGTSRVQELVDQFMASREKYGEVQIWAKPLSVANAIRNYVKRHGSPITVKTVGNRVFLVRGRPKKRRARNAS